MLELFLTAAIDPEDEPKARAVLKGLCARDGYETYTRSLRFQGPARPTAMANLAAADKTPKTWQAAAPLWKNLQTAVTKQSYQIELRYEIPYDGFGARATPVDYDAQEGILRFVDFPDPPAPSSNRAITARKKVEIWGQKNLPRVLQDNGHALKGELVDHTIQYFDDRGIEFCLSRHFFLADRHTYKAMPAPDGRALAPHIPSPEELQCIDPMKRSFLFVRLHVVDDNKPDEVVRAMDQLQAVQRELEGAIDFKHLDRRVFDTRVPLEVRTGPAPLPQVVTIVSATVPPVSARPASLFGLIFVTISNVVQAQRRLPFITAAQEEEASVANFFKPASEKAATAAALNKAEWSEQAPYDGAKTSMLVARYKPQGSEGWTKTTDKVKIAAFDLDSTLIEAASGKKFAKSASDWRWWDECVPEKLRSLHAEGFLIAIFSNQGGLTLHPDAKAAAAMAKNPRRTDRVLEYKAKCNQVLRALDLPVALFAATSKDMFRKPRTGMWDALLAAHALDAAAVDMAASFFVGDAAGRPAGRGSAAKDFSCSDRNLAANLGLPFFTPDEYFRSAEPELFVRDFDPVAVQREQGEQPAVCWTKKSDREMVIFCGPPGAGKSSFWWRHCEPLGYTRINQDRLGSRDKCITAAKRAIENGASVVIDNTNADTIIRGIWIKLARENNMGVRCVHFKTPLEMCVHNDHYRANGKGSPANPEDRDGLPGIAFGSFAKRYQAPTLDEGLDEIFETEFRFAGSDAEFAAWAKYWS